MIRIYLADLTYDTISITSDVFPLNVGLVASYCKKLFGNKVEIKLFKYIKELENAIENEPPDILGLSNYAWNHLLGYNIFKIALKKDPNILTVWGGPNFPLDLDSQKKFLKKYSEVDVYIPLEGEIGFSNLIQRIIELDSKSMLKQKIREKPIEGAITRNGDNDIQFSIPVIRTKNLDDIPSPYLTGLMDKFFDGKLTPMFQTNRGCPFSCTYCNDGSPLVQRVNMFSIDRVSQEIEYAAKNIGDSSRNILISDLNFGMYPRDLEICSEIREIQKKYGGFPEQIQTTTGKNNKEQIIQAIEQLDGALRLSMSVQSLDSEVLKNVKRGNISTDAFLSLAPTIKKLDLGTDSEVILGLPGETFESHVQTLRGLMRANIDHILVFNCMMLMGSEMDTLEYRKKFELKTKYRVLVRDFAKLSNGKNVVEVEEIIVSSNSLSFEEWGQLRALDFILYMTKIGVLFDPLLKYLSQMNLDTFDLPYKILLNIDKNEVVKRIIEEFIFESKAEFFESPDDIMRKYSNDREFEKLVRGEDGINILHYFTGLILINHLEEWIRFTFDIAKTLVESKYPDQELILKDLEELQKFSLGLGTELFSKDRFDNTPEYIFNYDIMAWRNDKANKKINEFKFSSPMPVRFFLSKKQFNLYQEHIENYSHPRTHAAELVKRIAIPALWRMAVPIDSNYDEKLIAQQIELRKTEKNTYANRKYNSKKDFWIKRDS
jgi:radical SAM superfamily enzyme YgiQ (UPF0313 family)